MDYDFKLDGCLRGFCAKGCGRQNKQLNTYDYLADVPGNDRLTDLVEVQFKNTRKGYFRNDNHLPLEKGDMVAVEASPGHDIGVVTLTGQLVPLQMKKANLKAGTEIKRIYRKARQVDIDKYEESKALEEDTMIRARQIAKELELNMKIGDVEYQGDGNKAIFYYIADARVDFRKLIKVLADAFHVRIEMRQIGARQEAGRIGGIGPCGRELCCATWMKNFNSVSTAAARFQDISPNPQKLAGQCAKLKCCLNYEADTYVEASRKLPPHDVTLETADSTYFYFKADILAGLVTYSTDKRLMANAVTISAERAHEVIRLNRAGEKPLKLDEGEHAEPLKPVDLAEQDDLTRFDKVKRRNGKGGNRSHKQGGDAASQNSEAATAQQGERGEQRRDRQRSERNQRRDRQRPDRQQAPDGSHRPDNNRRAAKNRPDRNAQRPGNRQAEENADKQ
jgi:cell fate regulator YaaT (PSP1 superfamily)